MAENKVRVSKLLGTDAIVGMMDPVVNMLVRWGIENRYIKTLDSDGVVTLALTQGGTACGKAYPHELQIGYTLAVSDFDYPNTNGSKAFAHSAPAAPATPNRFHVSNGMGQSQNTYA